MEEELWGWLLPNAEGHALSPEAAASGLARLSGRVDHLALLRRASFLQKERAALKRFVSSQLPALVRELPSQAQVEERTWEGGFHGRLNIPATMALHNAGQRARFVTRARRRDFALEENVLVVGVCAGLLSLLRRLTDERQARGAWLHDAVQLADGLERLLLTTALKEVPQEPIEARHHQAARGARHPGYGAALALWASLQDALGLSDPARVTKLVAEGALWPIERSRRFELAVLGALARRLVAWAKERPGWTVAQGLIFQGRDEVLTLRGPAGQGLSLRYDQSQPELSWRVQALKAYLGVASRARPDISVCVQRPGRPERRVLIEVKLSDRLDYLKSGFDEAIVYREENRALVAGGWPETILVTSRPLLSEPRRDEPVIAVGWDRWVPETVLEGVVSGL